ncbi:SAM-dependent methyltransferase [Fictibacillus sp. WQ 8-8]|nr:rRNA adenine N-6-methyltransferase family protein [Fictibacillus sp. WQ 8-8]MCQ6267716.1 SAM-dependent methyltransferase [Fictibacillus sp. WQ 8-8]
MSLSFVSQYIVKPRTVGAILPSSTYLAAKMVGEIDFNSASYIIELGPGTGVFTDKLLDKRNEKTTILIIEYNREFYKRLAYKYKDEKNFYVVNGSAENLHLYMKMYNIPYADAIVSGLPFASLPKEMSDSILISSKAALHQDGKFITFQYTKWKRKMIEEFFSSINVKKELRNMPPAYVFSCSKQLKNDKHVQHEAREG